jgi:Domain of unknown function (DUF4920)
MVRLWFAFLLVAACDRGPSKLDNTGTVAARPTTTEVAASTSDLVGTKYGAGVSVAETVSIDKILETPAAFKGKTVRVEGMVTDVCPKRGCWFEMAGKEPGHKLKFKVTDGEMVFPVDAKGQIAVAQGEIAVRELTLEETKQVAEYEAKEYGKPYDPASITAPKVSVRLDGTGAVFRKL